MELTLQCVSLYHCSTEAVFIHNKEEDIKMNSKTQFWQPAIPRVVTTREPRGEGGKGLGEGEEETIGLSANVFKFLGPVDRRKQRAY